MTHISAKNPLRGDENIKIPLCVDMDGTLIYSDLLIESALILLASRPLMILAMFRWLLKGKAYLKHEIAARVEIDVAKLPYNHILMDWLRMEHESGRHIVLCTASDILLANQVAMHAGVFDEVLASDGRRNLSGENKARFLVERYGERGFDYAGNARVDLAIWKHAQAAIVVAPGSKLIRVVERVTAVNMHMEPPHGGLQAWLKALRVHQWIKNILTFLPLLAAHRITDFPAVGVSVLAFFCFGLCASSVYLTNDLLDLPADRQHNRKRHRPLASGSLPLIAGLIAAPGLLIIAFVLAGLTSRAFAEALLSYYVLTTAYTLKLKQIMMLDVVVLSMLYTSRIIAGAAAIGIKPSFWLLAFSMFIFLSLAMIKRYVELLAMRRDGKVKASGRGYDVGDISLIQSLGGSSGYLAVLVLALYIDSTASSALYRHPYYLWVLCPLLLYWISRAWALAHRGLMHDDPVVFAVTDNTSRIVLMIAGIVALVAL